MQFTASDGSATAGEDYIPVSKRIALSRSGRSSVTVDLLHDTEMEGNETVLLTLSDPGRYTALGDPSTAVLIITENPDLTVDPVDLDPTAVIERNGRFIMPVDVTVRNIGGGRVNNVVVRYRHGYYTGEWQEETIPSLAPGESFQFHWEWDITDRVVRAKGDPCVSFRVEVDPHNAVREVNENNNQQSDTACLDVRPRIIEIDPELPLRRGYYIAGLSAPNLIRAEVDWNGDAVGTGEPPYGEVIFELNGNQVVEPGQAWGAQHTFDMGLDFRGTLYYANNRLRIQPRRTIHGNTVLQGEPHAFWPTVFSYPHWLQYWEVQGFAEPLGAAVWPPAVLYEAEFEYPDAFSAIWNVPEEVPFLGLDGGEFGITDAVGHFLAAVDSTGKGSVRVLDEGFSLLKLGGELIQGAVYGGGDDVAGFAYGWGLRLRKVPMGLEFDEIVPIQDSLVILFPNLRSTQGWWLMPRFVDWLSHASLTGFFDSSMDIQTEFYSTNYGLEFWPAPKESVGYVDATIELITQPLPNLFAIVYGGGVADILVRTPKDPQDPDYLHQGEIQIVSDLRLAAWLYEVEFKRALKCLYPGECTDSWYPDGGEESQTGQRAQAAAPNWHLIPRDYAGPDYARFRAAPALQASSVIQATATTTETLLVSNVYPRSEPA
ncbi:MAG: hypothetical protein D6770_03240, partial [Anaerolineae bacterium]